MSLVRAGSVAAGLMLALAACGGADTQAGATNPDQLAGEITFWDTSNATTEAPVFKELIADFEKKYPKIDVNYQNVPFADAQNKFKTAAQSGAGAPDVMRAEVAWTSEFASLGYLAPLDGTRALQDAEDFLATPMSSTQYKGKTYAVPQVTDSLALLYNKKLLTKAGIDDPPQTMKELREVAVKIGQETDAKGFYLNAGDGYYLLPHIYAHGGSLLDAENKRITVNDPAAVAGLEAALKLIESGAATEPALTDTYTNMKTAFKAGDVAMVFDGPWAVTDYLSGSAFEGRENLGVAPIPGGQGGPVGGHNYAVYAGSDNLRASYLFIRFMASPDSQAKVAEELGLLPTRKSVYERAEVKQNAIISEFRPVVEAAHPRPWIPQGGLLFEPLLNEYSSAVAGKKTPQQAMDAVAQKYQSFLPNWK